MTSFKLPPEFVLTSVRSSKQRRMGEMLEKLLREHPAPWRVKEGYGDAGGRFKSIEDANGDAVFDGETGYMDEDVFDFLSKLPTLASSQ
jgi:hypothetical protein